MIQSIRIPFAASFAFIFCIALSACGGAQQAEAPQSTSAASNTGAMILAESGPPLAPTANSSARTVGPSAPMPIFPPGSATASKYPLGQLLAMTFNATTLRNELVYVDPSSGATTLRTSVSFDNNSWSANTFSADPATRTTFAVASSGRLYIFAPDGSVNSNRTVMPSPYWRARGDGKLIGYTTNFPSTPGLLTFRTFDPATGITEILSSHSFTPTGINAFTQAIDIARGKIIFQANDMRLYIYDSAAKTLTSVAPGQGFSAIGVLKDGNLLAVTQGATLDLKKVNLATGVSQAIRPLPFTSYNPQSFAVDADTGYVYVSDSSRRLYTIDSDTGAILYNVAGPQTQALVVQGCYDSDQDGLCDYWETHGREVTTSNGRVVMLELAAMGADPLHKDIFIQVDSMIGKTHSHRFNPDGGQLIIDAFAAAPVQNPDGTTGINIHIDCGKDCVMDPRTATTWGTAYSRANVITEDATLALLGSNGCSSNPPCVDKMFATELAYKYFANPAKTGPSQERDGVFHYAVLGHKFADETGDCRTGKSIGSPGMGFLVTFGCLSEPPNNSNTIPSAKYQAGTFMHELGHSLGLRHGGMDNIQHKPNHLSVMNYSFQSGLIADRPVFSFLKKEYLDYSRYSLFDLDENALPTTGGLNGGSVLSGLWTRYACPTATELSGADWYDESKAPLVKANSDIVWECASGSPAVANINNDFDKMNSAMLTTLSSSNDWDRIVFVGGNGGNGGNGEAIFSHAVVPYDEPEISQSAAAVAKYDGPKVGFDSGHIYVGPNQTKTFQARVTNRSSQELTFALVMTADTDAVSFMAVPPSLTLPPFGSKGDTALFPITVTRGPAGTFGAIKVKIEGRILGIPDIIDSSTTTIFPLGDANWDGRIDLDDVLALQAQLNKPADEFNGHMDLNADGRIDAVDARLLTTLCDKPRCAR